MPQQQRPSTLLSVDDHELVRLGLRQVIVQHFADRFEVAEARSLEQALLFLERRVDEVLLVLLDLNLGDVRGLAGLKLLRQRYPALPIVVVSGTHDPRVREEALAHGAWGYVGKADNAGPGGLLDTIERIATLLASPLPANPSAGHVPAPAGAPARRSSGANGSLPRARELPPGVRLTGRQVQVLELILGGLDNQAIAVETGLALGSVKNAVSTVFLAFNVRSRAELIRLFA